MYEPYVTIAPMPSESVKNEWPSASRTLPPSNSPKLGRKMNPIASPAPSILKAETRSKTRIPKRIGRKTRAMRSIPFWTPK